MEFRASAQVNELTICRDNYDSKEAFENAIRDQVLFLINEDYIMTIKYDDKGMGIVVINYEYADESFGCPVPRWLTPDDEELLVNMKEDYKNAQV